MPSNIPQILSTGMPILDDGILADEGDTTSRTFKLTDLDNPKALHFRVEKQEE